jgi:hypothetical protein
MQQQASTMRRRNMSRRCSNKRDEKAEKITTPVLDTWTVSLHCKTGYD